ncbi:MAG TPA: hypothetical protein VIY69_17850 [Candidatus Acidoferrales bacterium]
MHQSDIRKTWKQYYESALEGLDLAKTQENVLLAEDALFLRWQELAGSPDHHNERNEMKRASDKLLQVKTRRLGWPGIES